MYTQNDYKILKNILNKEDKEQGMIKSKGTSVAYIVEKTGLSDRKVRVALKNFMAAEMICYGVSIGRVKTYCMLKKGLDEIKSLRESVI